MPLNTATVETLTAEVRVLMVGSRQVTLSVVRQLDYCDPEEITPFGRIRTGVKPSGAVTSVVEVIGSLAGALVRAQIVGERYLCSYRATEHADLVHMGQTVIVRRCAEHPGGAIDSHQWHGWPHQELHATWSELPLIVLAGLR